MALVPEKEVRELHEAACAFLREFAYWMENHGVSYAMKPFYEGSVLPSAERRLDEAAREVDWFLNAAP